MIHSGWKVPVLFSAASAVPAFVPTDIAGLKLWLKADAGTYQERTGASATTPASADGDPIGSWLDQSGNTNHFTSPADSRRFTLKTNIQNGRPVARTDGVDDFMSNATLSAASGSFTLYAVIAPTAIASRGDLLDIQTGRLIFEVGALGDETKLGWYDGGGHGIALRTAPMQVITWVMTSGGNGEVFRNGTSLGTAAYSAKALGGTVGLMCDFTGNNGAAGVTGDLAEMLLYAGAHTGAQQTSIASYINTRWVVY